MRYFHEERDHSYLVMAVDGNIIYECLIKGVNKSDYEANYKSEANKKMTDPEGRIITKTAPFTDKSFLFFRGTGITQAVAANSTENIIYTVPYAKCKINGVEVLNGNLGDTVNFKVKDTTTGTYSTVPNYLLNQFGYAWNVNPNGTYKVLPYDADLFINMQVVIEYTNNSGNATDIYINLDLHEDKS